ncbi:MAG: beta-ketoacyl-ACP synthase III [Polyangiaceae bacterium]
MSARQAVIAGTGLYTPPNEIDNDELVLAFNAWVDGYNRDNAEKIAAGELAAKEHSSAEFIEKASGIKSRYVMDKEGVLDVERMAPRLPKRSNDELALLAEMAATAGREALERAGRAAADVDAVIVAASNMQRAYPAVAIEVQNELGIEGFGFDMNVACSSATFGIHTAASLVDAGQARAVLVLNPEICSAHLDFRDRDSHFIFGDVATAALVEREDLPRSGRTWGIDGLKLSTRFSNNIRNNAGFLNRCEAGIDDNPGPEGVYDVDTDLLFKQEGRRVFKDVVPMVSALIRSHLDELGLSADDIKRMWLHQANLAMNRLIGSKVLGREPSAEESPTILDRYANTSSAGSVICFHLHSEDMAVGERGVLCSFGAGYSAGSVVLRRLS